MTFSSRSMAIAAGQIYYASGKKCKYEHPDSRYTKSGVCVGCHKARSKTKAESVRKAFKDKCRGLKTMAVSFHPDDEQQINGFINALLFDRGVY